MTFGFENNFRNFFLLIVYILKAEGMITASLFIVLFAAFLFPSLKCLFPFKNCSNCYKPCELAANLFSSLSSLVAVQFMLCLVIPI